jgi:hypothetical protein
LNGIRNVDETETDGQSYVEWLQAYSDYFDAAKDKNELEGKQANDAEVNTREDDHMEEPYKGRSIARVFMKGMIGDEESLPYRDQVDVVAGFAEQAICTDFEKAVALLDDRNSAGANPVRRRRGRPNWGPFTPKQLREELSKQVKHLPSPLKITNARCSASKSSRIRTSLHAAMMVKKATLKGGLCKSYSVPDESTSLIYLYRFLTDLNPSTMEAVLATAPRSHALALKNFFYEHLTGKAAMGVTIPVSLQTRILYNSGRLTIVFLIQSQGFKIFIFNLHIPLYVLKKSKELLEDSRIGFCSKPLRRSCRLPFLSGFESAPGSPDGDQCLYEAQISVTVTGINHRVWTAYGLFDTYHSSRDRVETYLQTKTPTGVPDPLTAGQLNAHNLIWKPREYFFKVFEIRINQVRREWRVILDKMVEDVEQYVLDK